MKKRLDVSMVGPLMYLCWILINMRELLMVANVSVGTKYWNCPKKNSLKLTGIA